MVLVLSYLVFKVLLLSIIELLDVVLGYYGRCVFQEFQNTCCVIQNLQISIVL